MKKIIYTTLIIGSVIILYSCSLFELDNYSAPDSTLQGVVTDMDGNPLLVESGNGIRIKLMDYGWHDDPLPIYLYGKMDGTYINTKVFSSTYDIVAEGPFVPLVQTDEIGNIIVDKTKKGVKVSGVTTIDFQVEPFLKVEWINEPTFENGVMSVQFKVTRGTDDPDWQLDLYDIGLFVYTTKYVGESFYDSRISNKITGTNATALINKVGVLSTLSTYPMSQGNTYYIRVGARLNYAFSFGAGYLYNYSEVKKVVVP
ncbi:MAG TPA: hypothetical protein DEB12_02375 [Porphyromonadaceae bacterium]|jgi:hypothetical protein|uniref:DUF3823 domain-containing protein n=1 Tax=Proteiniphilum sp. UBA5510 TaxID=1947286 RepID=UPI000E8D65CF|nr:DUF3823 domain-containing protein [Proteiniphilum sp. UBA5510]HBT84738.1 hypothetical protein [Porphyromonadaceae bacterium]